MNFGIIILFFAVLLIIGTFGFKFLNENNETATSKIESLEDLLERRKKNKNYRLPIFFFSIFLSLLLISWVFDTGYTRLGEKKRYQKVVEEIDTVLLYSVPPPPPPDQPEPEPEPEPEVVEVEVPDIVEVEEIKDTVKKIVEAPTVPIITPPTVATGPPQKIDTKIYFPDELDSQAEYPGGIEAETAYLQAKLSKVKPPAKYRKSGRAYTIKVYFVVDKDGSIKDVSIPGRYKAELDEATQNKIINAIKQMPKWTPGKVLDEPKKTRNSLPITL